MFLQGHRNRYPEYGGCPRIIVKIKDLTPLFKEFCKVILYNKKWKLFLELTSLLDKFPQFYPYVANMLVRHSNQIPIKKCQAISDKMALELNKTETLPEYIATAIVRLLGNHPFLHKNSLLKYFRYLRRNAGMYIGRTTIDAIYESANRGDVIEIRNCFDRADLWEKRSIIRLVNSKLSDEEKRPWLKNTKIHMIDDPFAIEIFDPRKKKKKKKKQT